MPIKLKDIADKSGFSVTTVSRALGGYDDVNEETRRQISEIAQSMGYQPNQAARQLRIQRTDTLGMIIPAHERGFTDAFFSELMVGVGHAAAASGYDLLISAQTSTEGELDAYHRIVGGNRVDGMILARTRQSDKRIAYLQEMNFPFVVSGRLTPQENSNFSYIDVDSQTGIQRLVQHLVDLGHQHLAFILPPADIAYTVYRQQGYEDALAINNIPYRADYVFTGDLKRASGYATTQHILKNCPDVTAIIACNDLMAMGAMTALQEAGLNIPNDIAVVGFDDVPAAQDAISPLTTVHQPIYEIGERLVELLIQLIQGQTDDLPQILLEPTLVIRESCGYRNKGGVRL